MTIDDVAAAIDGMRSDRPLIASAVLHPNAFAGITRMRPTAREERTIVAGLQIRTSEFMPRGKCAALDRFGNIIAVFDVAPE